MINYSAEDFEKYFTYIEDSSIDLILTDPPYNISRESGFKSVKEGEQRFAIDTEFEWDVPFDLGALCRESYRALKRHGTAIIFYDYWKLESLAVAMKTVGFKQLRQITWRKKNPVPINSKRNYLTNAKEMAVLGVKAGLPTFNSEYDRGEYTFAMPRNRRHQAQKPLPLIKNLICKHSDIHDTVLDPFMGSGVTAIACLEEKRDFMGCDINPKFVSEAQDWINEWYKKKKATK